MSHNPTHVFMGLELELVATEEDGSLHLLDDEGRSYWLPRELVHEIPPKPFEKPKPGEVWYFRNRSAVRVVDDTGSFRDTRGHVMLDRDSINEETMAEYRKLFNSDGVPA